MTNPNSLQHVPAPSQELMDISLAFAEDAYARSHSDDMAADLLEIYAQGVTVFAAHRQLLRDRVEAAGGVDRVNNASFSGSSSNYAVLGNGSLLYPANCMRSYDLPIPLDESTITVEDEQATLEYSLRMAFMGFGYGSNGSVSATPAAINRSDLGRGEGLFEAVLGPDLLFPNAIGLTGVLETSIGGRSDAQDTFVGLNTQHYTVEYPPVYRNPLGEVLGAPDPLLEPAEFQQWVVANAGEGLAFDRTVRVQDPATNNWHHSIGRAFGPFGTFPVGNSRNSIEAFRALREFGADTDYFAANYAGNFGGALSAADQNATAL